MPFSLRFLRFLLPVLAAGLMTVPSASLAAIPNAQGLLKGKAQGSPAKVLPDSLPRPATGDTGRKTR